MKKKNTIIVLLAAFLGFTGLVAPQKAIAQNCSCYWSATDNNCHLSDPDGCPDGSNPQITWCDTELGTGCVCVCNAPPTSTPSYTPCPGSCVSTAAGCGEGMVYYSAGTFWCIQNYGLGHSCCVAETTPSPAGGTPGAPGGPSDGGGGSIQTALGPIDVENLGAFVSKLVNIGVGIGGGIAILLILYGAFLVLTSSGKPDKAQAGKEVITAAIAGLLMIIFSVFILELLGHRILGIF